MGKTLKFSAWSIFSTGSRSASPGTARRCRRRPPVRAARSGAHSFHGHGAAPTDGEHLLALPPPDRYLRFGYAASDEQIGRYVDQLNFERDELFGIFNRKLELIAMAHLAFLWTRPATAAPSSACRCPRRRVDGVMAAACSSGR
jgi:hypothetical protein